jgi:outer membrane protein OmpA-like peptidoglycan-associated protein
MKMYLLQIIVCALVIFSHELSAQSSFMPKNLGPNVNSAYSEINPILSPDGNVLYFNRVNHPENTYGENDSQDVWMCILQGDSLWSPAVRLPSSVNSQRNNAITAVLENGNAILVNGIYYKNNVWKKRGFSTFRKSGEDWILADKITVKAYSRKNQGVASNSYVCPNGQAIIFSCTKRWDGKKNNLFVTVKNSKGKWKSPKKIKKPVSTSFREDAPFLSEDGHTLYFSSNRKKGGTGGNDIYSCTRLDDTYRKWSIPKLLADTINSTEYESYFKTNAKGSWGYFCSSKNSLGKSDIFKIKLFEENPFVLVSGKIINKTSGAPLTGRSSYIIKVDNQPVDSVKVNPETAEYSFHLPLNHSYALEGAVENYNSFPETVDVNGVREYTKITKDLMVESYPYVLLKGNLLVIENNSPIPSTANPKIWLDGSLLDSAIINPDGTYEAKIPFGKKYSILTKADQYNSIISSLDLSAVTEFEERRMDLNVNKVKRNIAVIQGKVIDNKTLLPLASGTDYYIQVDGLPHPAYLSKDSAYYRIELALGKTYIINAAASNYYPAYESIDMKAALTFITVNKNLHISPIEVGQSVKLNNIFYLTGKTTLKKSSYPELDKVVKFLKENPGIIIELGGHTDNVGNAASNLTLSKGRAKSVEVYLESKGIAPDRIQSKGYGMTKPVADNKTKEGKAKNRRVEFTILEK